MTPSNENPHPARLDGPRHEWTIGELARFAGATVRTLHHYDEIGLLEPSRRSAAGYRLYGEAEVARLLEILLLRRLGLSLAEIADTLAPAGDGATDHGRSTPLPRGTDDEAQVTQPGTAHRAGLVRALDAQIERLRLRIDEDQRLLRHLESMAHRLDTKGHLSVDEMTETLEMLAMYEKYYTPEQLDQLAARAEQVGPEAIAEAEAEWPKLIAECRAALDRGAAPDDPEVQDLARRWKGLTEAFTGGDPGITASLKNLWENEPKMREKNDIDGEVWQLMNQAIAALG